MLQACPTRRRQLRAYSPAGQLCRSSHRAQLYHQHQRPGALTATLCFPACTDTKGKVHLRDALVADNGCALPRRGTVRAAFSATPPPSSVPVLTTSFRAPASPLPAAAVLVRVALGQPYTATLLGTDSLPNPLTLTAHGRGFSLPAVGMRFVAHNGPGRAPATFPGCPPAGRPTALAGCACSLPLTRAAACALCPRAVRFVVARPADTLTFCLLNIIIANGKRFALPDLPPDFCGARFAGAQIFSRGRRNVAGWLPWWAGPPVAPARDRLRGERAL